MDKEKYKEYIDSLKSEIDKIDNKNELNKKMILSEGGSLFIQSMKTAEEHSKLVEELTEEGIWFYPICTKSEIIRLLNPKNCNDILLYRQADYIIKHCRTWRVFLKRKEIWENKNRIWSLTDFYNQHKNFSNYLNILKPHINRQCKSVESGFIFMVEPNGVCEKTEFGNIIYLSESLSYFLFYMNLTFLEFYNFSMDAEQNHESLLIGLRVMIGVESLDFDLDSRHDTLPNHVIESNNLLIEQQLMFIIGHEYAHHSLGHLNNSKLNKVYSKDLFKVQSGDNKIYNYSQKQEFEADWYAFKNAKLKKEEKAAMLNGAFLFFIYVDLYDFVKETISPSIKIYKTHPKPIDRLWNLRKKITNSIGYTRKELNEFIDYSTKIKDYLREDTLPFQTDLFELTGSIYLTKFKTKNLIDRIDF